MGWIKDDKKRKIPTYLKVRRKKTHDANNSYVGLADSAEHHDPGVVVGDGDVPRYDPLHGHDGEQTRDHGSDAGPGIADEQ